MRVAVPLVDAPRCASQPRDGRLRPSTSSPPPAAAGDVEGAPLDVQKTTMKKNVIHTTSFNFKEVVQKLTGASSNAQDEKLPVQTLRPSRSGNSTLMSSINGSSANKTTVTTGKVLDSLSVRADAGKVLKKSSSCKLLERRKGALRNLERLHAAKKPLPFASSMPSDDPLSPSPITPLTSYFEKFCNAVTPTTSQSSRNSDISSLSRQSVPEQEPSNMLLSLQTCASAPSSTGGAMNSTGKHCDSPAASGPSLLRLFPESPLAAPIMEL